MSDKKIIIEGNGDGFGQIWRDKTPEEKLVERLSSTMPLEEAECVAKLIEVTYKQAHGFI